MYPTSVGEGVGAIVQSMHVVPQIDLMYATLQSPFTLYSEHWGSSSGTAKQVGDTDGPVVGLLLGPRVGAKVVGI